MVQPDDPTRRRGHHGPARLEGGPLRWHRRFRHSLRWRLVALFLMLAFASTLIFLGGTRLAFSGGYQVLVKPLLADYVDRLAAEIGSPPDVQRVQALVARLPISVRVDGPTVNWESHPERRRHAHTHSSEQARDEAGQFDRTTADGHQIQFGIGDLPWRERRPGVVVWPLLALLLLTVAAYAIVRRMFRPLDDIRAGAMRYGAGEFDRVIPVRRRDELGDLATQVNSMASGLHGMLRSQRALLLAISHELRSPLTRARLNTELLADSAERQALLRDLAVMAELITDLLEGERLAAGSAALKTEPTDLNALVRDVVTGQFAEQAVRLTLADALPPLALDRPRVAMMIRNLIDNACRHAAAAGQPIDVVTRRDGEVVSLRVRDYGPGVPDEQLARLAEPFYRPDSARTRSTGGVGLGLYLCRLVAQSHGATMTLRNASPGLEVEIRWPG